MRMRLYACAATFLFLASACRPEDDGGNRGPSVGAIADQTVIQNTSATSLDLQIEVFDPNDAILSVDVTSSDEAVISSTTQSCLVGACALTLDASLGEPASVTLQVSVSDGGRTAETSFAVDVAPRLVTDVTDNGAGSLRQAIAEAAPGDVIAFDTGGVFGTPQTISLLSQLLIDEDLTIEGPGATELTLSGSSAVRVLRITGGADVWIDGVTITDGRAPVELITVGGTTTALTVGGGVYADGGSRATFSACTITGNIAQSNLTGLSGGGGVAAVVATVALLDGTQVVNNEANEGGGVFTYAIPGETVVVLEDSAIDNNQTTSIGGGIELAGGSLIATNSTINGNTADGAGGAIYNDGVLILNNTNMNGNTSLGSGGAIANDEYVELQDGAVLSGNQATGDGGGIYNVGAVEVQAGATITNNTAADGGGVFNTGSGELVNAGSITSNTPNDIAP